MVVAGVGDRVFDDLFGGDAEAQRRAVQDVGDEGGDALAFEAGGAEHGDGLFDEAGTQLFGLEEAELDERAAEQLAFFDELAGDHQFVEADAAVAPQDLTESIGRVARRRASVRAVLEEERARA